MAGKNQYKVQDFINAIPGTGGVIDTIARRVGCDWHTAKKYIEKHPTVKRAYENEKCKVDDAARSVVISDIVTEKNVDTAKWWLRVKIPDEFAPTQNVNQKTEHSGEIKLTPDEWRKQRQSRVEKANEVMDKRST